MEKILLQTVDRELKGRDSKNLRKAGSIPAELYGHNVGNIHLSVNAIEFEKVLRKAGESTIIELDMPNGGKKNVLIQNVQYHYLNSQPIHVDFFEVSMTEKLTATVPIEFIGESHAVKAMGGTLVKILTEVEVECLPGDLPQHFEVDISGLASFEDIITVADISHDSSKVEIKAEAEEAVAKVQPPRDVEAELAEDIDEAAAVAAAVGPEAGEEGEEATEGDKPEVPETNKTE
ncbi:MAG TPA: 50S ribosomal protein L25 [Candidatus Doudnabacteria bacterium]|nr:50S ribosomal protein L25 [Candidatus Doudnabacteria bacterium]